MGVGLVVVRRPLAIIALMSARLPFSMIRSLSDRSITPPSLIDKAPNRLVPAGVPLGVMVTRPATVSAASRMCVAVTEAGWAIVVDPDVDSAPRFDPPSSKNLLPPPVIRPLLVTGAKNTAVEPVLTRSSPPALLVTGPLKVARLLPETIVLPLKLLVTAPKTSEVPKERP